MAVVILSEWFWPWVLTYSAVSPGTFSPMVCAAQSHHRRHFGRGGVGEGHPHSRLHPCRRAPGPPPRRRPRERTLRRAACRPPPPRPRAPTADCEPAASSSVPLLPASAASVPGSPGCARVPRRGQTAPGVAWECDSSILEYGGPCQPDLVTASVASCGRLEREAGPGPPRAAWLDAAHPRGQVRLRLAEGQGIQQGRAWLQETAACAAGCTPPPPRRRAAVSRRSATPEAVSTTPLVIPPGRRAFAAGGAVAGHPGRHRTAPASGRPPAPPRCAAPSGPGPPANGGAGAPTAPASRARPSRSGRGRGPTGRRLHPHLAGLARLCLAFCGEVGRGGRGLASLRPKPGPGDQAQRMVGCSPSITGAGSGCRLSSSSDRVSAAGLHPVRCGQAERPRPPRRRRIEGARVQAGDERFRPGVEHLPRRPRREAVPRQSIRQPGGA